MGTSQLLRDMAAKERRKAQALEDVAEMIDSGELPASTLLDLAEQTLHARKARKNSYAALAAQVLQEHGRPMTTDEIHSAVKGVKKDTDRASLMGALYRSAKGGVLFKLTSPGVFGLLEWVAKGGNGSTEPRRIQRIVPQRLEPVEE